MSKYSTPLPGRATLYVDGPSVAACADLFGDPSLNWMDLVALARMAGMEAATTRVVQFSAAGSAEAGASYVAALRAQGVDCRTAAPAQAERECLRCGHGWSETEGGTELALTFAVLAEAAEDLFDTAVLLASDRLREGLEGPFARLFAGKRLLTLSVGANGRLKPPGSRIVLSRAAYASARLPALLETSEGAPIAQPACWRPLPPHGGRVQSLPQLIF